jgi:putative nucleotidyltransferase with HDIG domain
MSSNPTTETMPTTSEESRSEVSRAELSADTLEALAVDTPLLPTSEPLGARLASYFGRHLILLFWFSFGCLWAILSIPSTFNRPDFSPGDTAPRDFIAPQNAFLPDRAETESRRAAAASLVTPAYDPAPSAQSQALFALRDVVAKSRRAAVALRSHALTAHNGAVLQKQFARQAGWKPDTKLLPTLRDMQPLRWKKLETVADAAVREAYLKGRIRSDVGDDLNQVRPLLRLGMGAGSAELSQAERDITMQLAALSARFPNVVANQKATDDAREDAAAAVLPVFQRIEANTPVVREGERVSAEQFEQLQALGLIAPEFNGRAALANGAICLLLSAGAAAYLARGRRDLLFRPAALWLVAAVPVLFLFIFRMLLGVPHADFMMVPLAACAAMLLTVLIDTRVGLPAGFLVAALCALMARSEAGLFLAATLSAWIGALAVAQLSSRFALLRCIALLTVSNAILAFALGVLRESPIDELLSSAAWSALAGAGSVVAMAGLAIFLERPFGITSHLRLLELLAPDETVIRRMQLEAPGTYTHSMTVAILAEAAAKAVGADPLLSRVGGLYHDIGKLRRPHCFIENQSGDNIHDRLSPGLSALLIKAHVKDGLELGRAVRLPAPVLEILASHHGTSTIAYFLHRARQQAEVEQTEVDEKIFRYPGPRPRSKEAAIVLLADSVEASARSLPQITPESLAAHVQKLISARLAEGELDECDLSLREMSMVRDSFVSVLRGVLHGRIAYPDPLALSGELAASSRDWVREALGDRNDESNRSPRNNSKGGVGVAAASQKRQNKEQNRGHRPQNSDSDAPDQLTGQPGVVANAEANGPGASGRERHRFKPSFHATGHGTTNRQTSQSQDRRGSDPGRANGNQANGNQANGNSAKGSAANGTPPSSTGPGNQPQLEPGSTTRPGGPAVPSNGTGAQKNGSNGHSGHAPDGAAALSGAQNPAADR